MRLILVCSGLLAVCTAQAQIDWLNPVSGNWNDATKWAGGNVPDTAGEVANIAVAGSYTVTFDFTATIGGMTLLNPAATVDILAGQMMAVGATTWTNDGLVVLNSSGANAGTYIRTDVPALTFGGSGIVRLNAFPTNLDTAALNTSSGARVLTNGADHTISGVGRIRIAMINDGLIRADATGSTLDLAQFAKTNNGVIEAVGGGILAISGIPITNDPEAIIRAEGAGSLVQFASADILGGTVRADSGGVASISNTSFGDVTFTGSHEVVYGSYMYIVGAGITNNGTITVNPAAINSGTYVRTDVAAATLGGTGALRLNAYPTNLDTAALVTANGARILTNGPDHTIGGVGRIRIALVNQGLIRADVAGSTLELAQFGKTNENRIEAVGGGNIQLDGMTVANGPAGVIRAEGAGSTANYMNATVTGGTLEAVSGGVGAISNCTFSDTTLSGPHQVNANSMLILQGAGITNNGTLTVNPTRTNSGTYVRTDAAAATLGGTGTLVLNAVPSNLDTAALNTSNGARVLTNAAGHSIVGVGRIRIAMMNDGLIRADVAGSALELTDFVKTNKGTIEAVAGGIIECSGVTISNAGSGGIRAQGDGSVARYVTSTIVGGQLFAVDGGVGAFSNATLDSVTLTGPHQVDANSTLIIVGSGITNEGTLTVNATGANQGTYLRTDVASATIDGPGTVLLNAVPSNLDTAQLSTNSGARVIRFAADQTLAGTGAIRIETIHEGRLSPGSATSPVGRIEQRNFSFTQTPTSVLAVDLGGTAAGQYDTFSTNGTVALDGTLEVHAINGFIPALGDEFVIVTAGSRTGTFEQIVSPNPGPNNAWRVRYEPNRAVLTVTCPPDIDGDHAVSLQDLAALLAHFGTPSGASSQDGDLDGDGDIDLQDLAGLLGAFGTTCP
ncbi:MAG: hypothetical protein IT450_08620 [Phycisphaerales bacterium]|nr:hypothetical protein [Phycisphaerales bacterium]